MKGIRVRGLSKSFAVKKKEEGPLPSLRSLVRPSYTEKLAVHDIDLTVEPGRRWLSWARTGPGSRRRSRC
ncbi:hypothetical protein LJK88_10705 [Paenibacillus sp. P26]|nr:hypothetical protein LJK88_10705 [Paenibacillus sp. P26]UUZ89717.1 hypothetical protein LJK87_26975 [Paenibacillus sp. P25]